ncbi:DUF72 domain-containing protein [Rhodanobacter sp. C03]|uniref:DUF72 domain-containing protein n=1 Tax=Rhodanobacter sp. C03 TaxID=1945858 RepID=UPI0009875316|nr:DUF72 domain-containing protein [Rhodanobacter sp. C03]OOG52326.1 hypothetical protein B0E48_17310 [Rhodanobacter sp. C03]
MRPTIRPQLYIGCAGWAIPKASSERFPEDGSHLQRYAQVFNGVEINSSFYRSHQPATYARWASSVPGDFRFAVKMPRTISHQARLFECSTTLHAFLSEVHQLGSKLGCLLLQLPPGLAYTASVALPFFEMLRRLHLGPVACEPRHVSWFAHAVDRQLIDHDISRVAADPAPLPRAAVPAGDPALQYLRLHGSPRIYYDSYPEATLHRISLKLRRPASHTAQRWCIFDNTALGHATSNALDMLDYLGDDEPPA